jgi:hypothetical protein
VLKCTFLSLLQGVAIFFFVYFGKHVTFSTKVCFVTFVNFIPAVVSKSVPTQAIHSLYNEQCGIGLHLNISTKMQLKRRAGE